MVYYDCIECEEIFCATEHCREVIGVSNCNKCEHKEILPADRYCIYCNRLFCIECISNMTIDENKCKVCYECAKFYGYIPLCSCDKCSFYLNVSGDWAHNGDKCKIYSNSVGQWVTNSNDQFAYQCDKCSYLYCNKHCQIKHAIGGLSNIICIYCS